jgi:hypothetical protein
MRELFLMARYNYPTARNDPGGAIPVYIVAAPSAGPPWPNKQINGAIPITIMGGPGSPHSGPIPVRIVAGPGPGPKWPSDQGQDAGAAPLPPPIVNISGHGSAVIHIDVT